MTRPVSRLGLAALACIAAQACLLAVPARAVGPTSPLVTGTWVAGTWVAGTWVAGDGRTLVRTEPCRRDETRLCGYVVGLRDGGDRSLRDGRNPIAERQARTLIGHQVLLGLRPAEGGQYKGWAYDAASGKSVFVTVSGGQSGGLVVQGDLPAAICGYQIWSRSGDGVPGQLTGATDMAGGPRSDPEWAALKAVSNRATDRRKHLASGTPAPGQ